MSWHRYYFQPVVSRWVESFVEQAYGSETLASVGFRSSTATYIICNLITPAYLNSNSVWTLLSQRQKLDYHGVPTRIRRYPLQRVSRG